MREISRHNVSRSRLWRPGELMIKRRRAGPSLPVIRVTGGEIKAFSRSGINYTEILFKLSGSMDLSAPVSGLRWCLAAGGANGGMSADPNYIGAGGGAGGLILSPASVDFAAGLYSISIGAGAPANTVPNTGYNGSDSKLVFPGLFEHLAKGGGRGAGDGNGNYNGMPGGSGGGARGGTVTGPIVTFGVGTASQGWAGGEGYGSSTTAAERASGGGGGAGGKGGNASPGVPGVSGPGHNLTWTSAASKIVCVGGLGLLSGTTGDSPNQTWGNGSRGAIAAKVGAGGPGFAYFVVPANAATVVMA